MYSSMLRCVPCVSRRQSARLQRGRAGRPGRGRACSEPRLAGCNRSTWVRLPGRSPHKSTIGPGRFEDHWWRSGLRERSRGSRSFVPSARALPVAARTHTQLGTVAVVEGAASDAGRTRAVLSVPPLPLHSVRSKQWMGDFSITDPAGSSLGA